MPTLVPLPSPLQPLSSHPPKQPLPYLPEVRCLLGRCPVLVATLRLHHLYLEPMQLHLPLVPHLLPFQLGPPTPPPTRCPPLQLLRPQWSTMPAVTCWLLYVWVRAEVCVRVFKTTYNRNAVGPTKVFTTVDMFMFCFITLNQNGLNVAFLTQSNRKKSLKQISTK